MRQRSSQIAVLAEQDPVKTDELQEIQQGLARPQKTLPPKFFYDERGSALFDTICELPEYYPTRTELQIMQDRAGDIAERVGPGACVIELGSGSSLKTRILLASLTQPVAYVPVDISRDHLAAQARALAEDFPDIEVLPVAADFTRPFCLPEPRVDPVRNLVYFPGSTIGNFSHTGAQALLRVIHQEAGPEGALLIGIDLKKDSAILHAAYNDSSDVTAEFNLNMLRRINRDFGADFLPDAFRHRAIWDEARGRIEMHLVSRCQQHVRVGGETYEFERGEYIVTEHSHKYTPGEFAAMAERAGFRTVDAWTDPRGWFSVQFCLRR